MIQNEPTYAPDYIKIAPQNPSKYFLTQVTSLERNKFSFGMFQHQTHSIPHQWALLIFHPYSQDVGFPSPYASREEALAKALYQLAENGFRAQAFDLESIVNDIPLP